MDGRARARRGLRGRRRGVIHFIFTNRARIDVDRTLLLRATARLHRRLVGIRHTGNKEKAATKAMNKAVLFSSKFGLKIPRTIASPYSNKSN